MVRSSAFSQHELISILEVIESAGACATPDDLKALLVKGRELLGADYAISGACSISVGGITGVDVAVNAGYPQEFVDLYISERFFDADPVVRYLSRYSLTQSWTEIFERVGDASSVPVMSVVGTACDFGLRHGLSTGVYIPGPGKLNVLSFAGPRDSFGGHQKKVLDVLSLHLNNAIARVLSPIGPSRGALAANNRLQG